MTRYRVWVEELFRTEYIVEADNEDEARDNAAYGDFIQDGRAEFLEVIKENRHNWDVETIEINEDLPSSED